MEKEQGLQIVEQALDAAIMKGIYNINDVRTILIALDSLKKEDSKEEVKDIKK